MLLVFDENIEINTFSINKEKLIKHKILDENSKNNLFVVFTSKNEKFAFKCSINERKQKNAFYCNLDEMFISKLKNFKINFEFIEELNTKNNQCVFNYFPDKCKNCCLSSEFILDLKTKLLNLIVENNQVICVSDFGGGCYFRENLRCKCRISFISPTHSQEKYSMITNSSKLILLSTSFGKKIKFINSDTNLNQENIFDLKTFSLENFTSILVDGRKI